MNRTPRMQANVMRDRQFRGCGETPQPTGGTPVLPGCEAAQHRRAVAIAFVDAEVDDPRAGRGGDAQCAGSETIENAVDRGARVGRCVDCGTNGHPPERSAQS